MRKDVNHSGAKNCNVKFKQRDGSEPRRRRRLLASLSQRPCRLVTYVAENKTYQHQRTQLYTRRHGQSFLLPVFSIRLLAQDHAG